MSAILNVLMFDAAYPPPVVGGKEKQAHLLAKELMNNNVQVHVLSYCHNGNTSGVHEGVSITRVKQRRFLGLPVIIWFLAKYRFTYGILHIHTPSRIGRTVAILGFLFRYKTIFKFPTSQLLDDLTGSNALLWSLVLICVDVFVVLETGTKLELVRRNIPNSRIFSVPNGIEVDDRSKLARQDTTGNVVRLLFAGRLVPSKCCDILVKACSLIKTSHFEWHLTIVGDGPLYLELKRLATTLGIVSKVYFAGHQTDVLSFMKSSDILVLPSEKEGMSNVLLEAISVGLPIVATDVGAVRKQVGDMGQQFLCKPFDPECLAVKIKRLATDHVLRKEYGQYLHERGKGLFSIETIAKQYIEKYTQLL